MIPEISAQLTGHTSQIGTFCDDQVLINPGENLYLYLPDGYEYHLTGHRGDGSLVGKKPIKVEVFRP